VLLKYEIDADGEKKMVAKISDFGLCRQTQLVQQLQGASVDNPTWLAPEVLRNEPYNASADMYSMGVIMWELLTRKDFGGDVQFTHMLADDIVSGKRPTVPECPALFEDYGMLLQQCWSSDARQRPAGREALACLRNMVDFANDPELKEQYELAMLNRALGGNSSGTLRSPRSLLLSNSSTSLDYVIGAAPLSSSPPAAAASTVAVSSSSPHLNLSSLAMSSPSALQSPQVAKLERSPSSERVIAWDAMRLIHQIQRQLDAMAESHARELAEVRTTLTERIVLLESKLDMLERGDS
jgi:serine/threonine protein kinase